MPTSFKLSIALIITSVTLGMLYSAVEFVPLWVGEIGGTMMFAGIVVGLWGLYRKFRSGKKEEPKASPTSQPDLPVQSELEHEREQARMRTDILKEEVRQAKLKKEIEKLKADD